MPNDPRDLINSVSPQPTAHVRGAAIYEHPATFGSRFGAAVIDGAVCLTLFFLLHRALRLTPVPSFWWGFALVSTFVVYWSVQRMGLGRTLGDTAWRLRSEGKQPWTLASLRERLLRPTKLSGGELASGAFLTVISVVVCAWAVDKAVFQQPLWARAETLELDAYLPDMASGEWEVLPFFYSLGAWPQSYRGKPVFYSLPYEKGPPTRFVGHLSAHWDDPGTHVTFEGPKTPQAPVNAQPGDRTPRDTIRECLLGGSHSWQCLKIREATLQRHLIDMQERLTGRSGGNTALKMKWSLRWFLVKNAALAPTDQAQGIYLSAEDEGKGEERYILITENGTHQAILLDYPAPGSTDAQYAQKVFGQAIRSLRASDELGPGRAWIDRRLESVNLSEFTSRSAQPASNPESIARLAQVQSLLLAKITVQPSIFDSYFHLGGTALLLNRIARNGKSAGHLEGLELSAIAKPLIQNAYRFAQDVAPQDPRTTLLQGFWLEAREL